MLNRVAAMIPTPARAIAVVCVFALSAACGAPGEPAAPLPAAPAPTAPAVGYAPAAPLPAAPAPTAAPAPQAEPTICPRVYLMIAHQGATSPEELMFLSDVIARVRLISAEAGVRRYPTRYTGAPSPILAFRFRVIEYLKGRGDDELTVRVHAEHDSLASSCQHCPAPTPTADETLRTAQARLAERDARWDDSDAVVFLRSSIVEAEAGDYEFTTRSGMAALGSYAVASNYYSARVPNRAWLPGGVPSDAAANGPSSSEPRYFTGAPAAQTGDVIAESALSLSLSEIKSIIATHADMMAENKDVPGYAKCVMDKFKFDALYRERPPKTTFHETSVPSGQPAGYKLWGDNPYAQPPSPHYARWWFAGPDSDLFAYRITDDPDNDPATGYAWEQVALRPVPEGEYKVFVNSQPSAWVPCGYNPEALMNISEDTIIATAPDGVVHEAFFDPADMIGESVGTDGTNGVLKPTAFALGGAGVSLESIRWESRTVEMRFAPHPRLANYHADFIALDGSVALRLDFNDAAETGEGDARALSWRVCSQPWQAGDLLMLRISESPADLIGATRCVSVAATPTPGG